MIGVWGPVVGRRLNVSPAGTWVRPSQVVPWAPGVYWSVTSERPWGSSALSLAWYPRCPTSQSAAPLLVTAAP